MHTKNNTTSVHFYGLHFSSINSDFFSLHEIKMRLHIIISPLCKLSFDCICNIKIQSNEKVIHF